MKLLKHFLGVEVDPSEIEVQFEMSPNLVGGSAPVASGDVYVWQRKVREGSAVAQARFPTAYNFTQFIRHKMKFRLCKIQFRKGNHLCATSRPSTASSFSVSSPMPSTPRPNGIGKPSAEAVERPQPSRRKILLL